MDDIVIFSKRMEQNRMTGKEMNNTSEQKIVCLTENQIEEVANLVSKNFGTLDDVDVDVIKIAKGLGFTVIQQSLKGDLLGYVVIRPNDKAMLERFGTDKVISVKKDIDYEHKKFAIAHELGHFLLHYDSSTNEAKEASIDGDKGLTAAYVNDNEKRREAEACKFAAFLLMGKDIFQKKYSELHSSEIKTDALIQLLAGYFKVPKTSVKRRIDELGLCAK